jgi:glycosyltransferase involved in cell wall biosynthesis
LGPGGAEQLLLNQALAADHDAFAYEAAYLVPWKDHLVGALEDEGVRVHPLDAPREWDARWTMRLRRLVRGRGIDVVHIHSPYVASLARPVLRTMGPARPAIVYTEHNLWARHSLATRVANRLTLGFDDHTLAVSDAVRDSMPARCRDRIEVLVHGIPLDAVRARADERGAVRHELAIGDDELVVGTVANLRKEKAYPDLLQAARIVLDRQPRARFVAVGQGPLEDEIRAEHASLGLGDRFALLGYRPDAVRVMAGFDIFVLASRHEGLPVALLDALALGLPVVSTDVGGISTAIADGTQGLLVPARSPKALADAVIALLDDEARRGRMSAAAAARAKAFGSDAPVRRLEEIYAEVAGRAGARRPSSRS